MKLTPIAQATGHTVPRISSEACDHSMAPAPQFDKEAARSMSTSRIRTVFPRFDGPCPGCGVRLIKYASWDHYIYGDW